MATEESPAEKYLRRFATPLYLPLDDTKADAAFDFEGPKHPHFYIRPMTAGEIEEIENATTVEQMTSPIARAITRTKGDFSLALLARPWDGRWPEEAQERQKLLADRFAYRTLVEITRTLTKRSAPTKAEREL